MSSSEVRSCCVGRVDAPASTGGDCRHSVFDALCEALVTYRSVMAELAELVLAQRAALGVDRFEDAQTLTCKMLTVEERLVGVQVQIFHAVTQLGEHVPGVTGGMPLLEVAEHLPEVERVVLHGHITLHEARVEELELVTRVGVGDTPQSVQ